MKTTYKTTSSRKAKEQGFSAITDPYTRDEFEMLDKAIETLRGTAFMLVEEGFGIAIYRKKEVVS